MLVKFLKSLSCGFLFGVIIHSYFLTTQIPLLVIIVGSVIALVLILTSWKSSVIVGVFLIGVLLGVVRFSANLDHSAKQILDPFVDHEVLVTVQGTIVSEPITRTSYTQFNLAIDSLIVDSEHRFPIETQALVKTDIYTEYEYGQKVSVTGVLQKPASFTTETNRIFHYDTYLRKDGIYYIVPFAETSLVDSGEPGLQRSLYQLKQQLLGHIYRLIPEPESGLLAGILFGQKSALGDSWEDIFRTVGLMHIVVLSGYNVSLVISVFTKTLRFLPVSIRSLLAVLSIAAFALLVGAGPTVIRASIMAVFIVLADMFGGRYNITRALVCAGIIMVIWNPMILYFDISFQLSFLATYGLIVIAPYMERWLQRLPTVLAIRESAVATLSAQIMVLPLIAYHIGEFSLISPVVNVLVLFAVPWAMLGGFVTSVLAFVSPVLATVPAFITSYLLRYQLWIAEVFAQIPFARIIFPPFHIGFMFVCYAGIIVWIYYLQRLPEKKI